MMFVINFSLHAKDYNYIRTRYGTMSLSSFWYVIFMFKSFSRAASGAVHASFAIFYLYTKSVSFPYPP